MMENVIRSIGGVGVFGLLSVCFFIVFFAGMLFWVARLKKSHLTTMSGLPLEGENSSAEESDHE